MEAAMKKYFSLLAVLGCLTMASAAFAQLPTNPWSPKPNDGYFEEVANKPAEEGVPTIPEYSGGQTKAKCFRLTPGPNRETAAASKPGAVLLSTAN